MIRVARFLRAFVGLTAMVAAAGVAAYLALRAGGAPAVPTARASTPTAFDATVDYDFRDPKRLNSVSFLVDGALEPIAGVAGGVTGRLRFDPAAPERTTGQIVVASRTLVVANDLMTIMIGERAWLDAERYPAIRFRFERVEPTEPNAPIVPGEPIRCRVTGTFFLKSVARRLTIPVSFVHLPGAMRRRNGGPAEGDLLVVRASFSIRRADFDFGPRDHLVGDLIHLRVAIVGCRSRGSRSTGW